MSLKKYLVNGLVAFSLGAILLTGCSQPPTEKVTALQNEVKDLEAKGAQVFAADQYAAVSQKMAELQNNMDQKKYKEASALADSITLEVAAIDAAIDSSASEMTTMAVANAKTQFENFKAVAGPENLKVLGDEAAMVQEQVTGFEAQVMALDSLSTSGALAEAYNNSMSITDQISAANSELSAKIEAAKAAKPSKGKK